VALVAALALQAEMTNPAAGVTLLIFHACKSVTVLGSQVFSALPASTALGCPPYESFRVQRSTELLAVGVGDEAGAIFLERGRVGNENT